MKFLPSSVPVIACEELISQYNSNSGGKFSEFNPWGSLVYCWWFITAAEGWRLGKQARFKVASGLHAEVEPSPRSLHKKEKQKGFPNLCLVIKQPRHEPIWGCVERGDPQGLFCLLGDDDEKEARKLWDKLIFINRDRFSTSSPPIFSSFLQI